MTILSPEDIKKALSGTADPAKGGAPKPPSPLSPSMSDRQEEEQAIVANPFLGGGPEGIGATVRETEESAVRREAQVRTYGADRELQPYYKDKEFELAEYQRDLPFDERPKSPFMEGGPLGPADVIQQREGAEDPIAEEQQPFTTREAGTGREQGLTETLEQVPGESARDFITTEDVVKAVEGVRGYLKANVVEALGAKGGNFPEGLTERFDPGTVNSLLSKYKVAGVADAGDAEIIASLTMMQRTDGLLADMHKTANREVLMGHMQVYQEEFVEATTGLVFSWFSGTAGPFLTGGEKGSIAQEAARYRENMPGAAGAIEAAKLAYQDAILPENMKGLFEVILDPTILLPFVGEAGIISRTAMKAAVITGIATYFLARPGTRFTSTAIQRLIRRMQAKAEREAAKTAGRKSPPETYEQPEPYLSPVFASRRSGDVPPPDWSPTTDPDMRADEVISPEFETRWTDITRSVGRKAKDSDEPSTGPGGVFYKARLHRRRDG